MFSERVPPQNLEAEQCVLGAMLINPNVFPQVRQILRKEDFYSTKHGRLYEIMCSLYDKREPSDIITVRNELMLSNELNEVGGITFLTSLTELMPTTANAGAYAKIVAEKAEMRRIQHAARKVVEQAYGDIEAEDLKKFAMQEIQGAIFSRTGSGVRDVAEDLLEYIESSRNASADGKPPASLVKVPFERQHYVMPMVRGETTAVGAGSNIGKTTYMFNLMLGVARLDGPVIGFSLEMSKNQMMQKWWGRIAGVNTLNIRHTALTEEEWERSILKAAEMQGLPLKYMVRPRMTWTDIGMEASAFKARYGKLSLICIDYWQILNDMPRRDERRDQLLGRLVEEAKALAVELDCHVAFLVQTAINPEQPIPNLRDVIESRDIVRYADNTLFLTRPAEFIGKIQSKSGERTSPKIQLPTADGSKVVEVACDAMYPHIPINGERYRGKRMFDNVMIGVQGKQRMGPKDVIPYWIDLPTSKMADLDQPWPWDNPKGSTPRQRIPD